MTSNPFASTRLNIFASGKRAVAVAAGDCGAEARGAGRRWAAEIAEGASKELINRRIKRLRFTKSSGVSCF